MSAFSIENFKSEVYGRYGLAKTNRFEVFIIPPPRLLQYGRQVSIMVEQAYFPFLNIGVKPHRIFGPAHQRPVNVDYGGDGVNLSIHVDGNMQVKKFFDDWSHLVVNSNDFTVNYQENYSSIVTVRQLNDLGKVTYEATLYEAFPRNVNQMALDNASQAQTHRVHVLFSFRYWKENKAIRMSDIPQYIQKPQIPREK